MRSRDVALVIPVAIVALLFLWGSLDLVRAGEPPETLLAVPIATPTVSIHLPRIEKTGTRTATSTLTRTQTATPTHSHTPTGTKTPTVTWTPTRTPTRTPTSAPSGVYILPNHTYYVDSINYLHILGEVWNNTSNYLRFVKITANVFRQDGQLLATDFTYIHLDNLAPADKTCFEILLSQPAGWASYRFESPSFWTDGEPAPNLFVYNHSGSYDSRFGWYTIIGLVRNNDSRRVEYVSPVGTAYDVAGKVIGCESCYVSSTHLDPGQESSFEMLFTGRDYSDLASYRLQVDGNPR